jgi:transaldolase
MKLFLDSADPDEIRELSRWRVIDGVTTTPTFFRRLGVGNAGAALREIVANVKGEIHVEALGQSVDEIVEAARRNRDLGPNIVSKIPVGRLGIEAAGILEAEGLPVNVHLVFCVNHAVMAAKAGASYVCPLMGRMNDAGLNAAEVISNIIDAVKGYPEFEAEVMVSSIRNTEDVRRSFLMSAPAITIPGRVLKSLYDSPLTEKAHAILARDTLLAESVESRMLRLDRLPTLEPSVDVHEVMVAMTVKGVGIVAIVDQGKVVGVITDGDLRRTLLERPDSRDAHADAIMTRDPVRVHADDPLSHAVDMMRSRQVNEVLVVDSADEPLGLVELQALLNAPEER